jgi:ABC-type sugar transport system substrate-binding protein
VKKTVRWGASSLLAAAAVGATLLAAPAASAATAGGFVCPAGSDTFVVPSTQGPVGQPPVAGTVCTFAGTTAFRSVDKTAGWRFEVKSPFGSKTSDVRFYIPGTSVTAEFIYTKLGQPQFKTR